MNNKNCIDVLSGGLIVSCQPVVGGPLDSTDIVGKQALAAQAGGAQGIRAAGIESVQRIAEVLDLPIIGLTKRDLADSKVRITPTPEDAVALIKAGANIVAYDATARARPVPTALIVAAINDAGGVAMADCANLEDGIRALDEGALILGSTLSGYAEPLAPETDPPDLILVQSLAALDGFVIAEGRIRSPEQAAEAVAAGADAVVVGSAITRVEHITDWYSSAIDAEFALVDNIRSYEKSR